VAVVLHVDASDQDAHSLLRRLSAAFAEEWAIERPDGRLLYRDLAETRLAQVSAVWTRAAYTPADARTPDMQHILALSDALVDELLAADCYVFSVPQYNLTLPAKFTAYLDHIVRMGRTFHVDGNAVQGTLAGRKALVITARELNYHPLPWAQFDNHEPYLRSVLGMIGLTDLTFIRAEAGILKSSTAERELESALAQVREVVRTW